jgi:hypothetical protein
LIEGERTWEDYDEFLSKKFPVRYFLFRTVPSFVRISVAQVKGAIYWLKCHTLPSHKFHILDLRKADPTDQYNHGYIDPRDALEKACWLVLQNYISENPTDPAMWWSAEEIASNPSLKESKRLYDEVNHLYYWWTVTRFDEKARSNTLMDTAIEAKRSDSAEAWRVYFNYSQQLDEKADKMLIRLIKIRRSLWT